MKNGRGKKSFKFVTKHDPPEHIPFFIRSTYIINYS
jgi:hypothetical protein